MYDDVLRPIECMQVDDRENHGEVPGTPAYQLRTQDAVPDEIEVMPEGKHSSHWESKGSRPQTPGGSSVPTTMVEKIDPTSPSHGDVPGTHAHSKRMADAVPDVIKSASHQDEASDESSPASRTPDVPMTVITKVDSRPSHGEVPGTEAFNVRTEDATPDLVERKGDVHSE